MKAIIRGRRYNTEAKGTRLIAEAQADGPTMTCTDFRWWSESLYRTLHGRWFLHGQGGPMSRWASRHDGGSGWGETIRPLEPDQARDWLEQESKTEALEQYFNDQIEDA
jgi:hypothetical protein